ncbi:MAG: metallophosphoesterase [Clostridiales bacterium]|nr:metallophosphoesterase [Clostridiales bacterium]MCD7828441.1 metallophosphoesterase [Clostridiales bacterium]
MVYITGDIHGDFSRLAPDKLKFMKLHDTLIICGDFGFIWDDSKKEDKLLRNLGKRKYNICFVDGTHENFNLLNKFPAEDWNGGKARNICGNLYHLMRGQIYTIEGMKVFTMGGGESPEAELRFPDEETQRLEIPTKEELLAAVNRLEKTNYNVDLIITHEPPSKTMEFLLMQKNEQFIVSALNAFFDELAVQCKYKKWYFGSMHMDKYISANQVAVFKNILNAKTGMKI